MKITITTMGDALFTLDVSDDMELFNFKALCEVETGIPAGQMVVMFEGKPLLDDKKTLKDCAIKEGDVVLLQGLHSQIAQHGQAGTGAGAVPSLSGGASRNPPSSGMNFDFGSIRVPPIGGGQPGTSRPEEDPAHIRDLLLANPDQVAILKVNNPRLAEALLSNDLNKFTEVLREQQDQKRQEEQRRLRMLLADPFDAEAQRMIAEEIQRQQIDSNMETAMEYHPEAFGQVTMLYIDCKVNGFPVKAFVDSGAQSTIMSKDCAERCNITRLIDTRWSGIAKGVGTQRILGRIHLCQIQIETDFLASSFSILEEQPMDMLLGLDMLKRHQCIIDLKENLLIIGTSGTKTRFLNESELPESAKHKSVPQDEDSALAEAINRSVKEQQGTQPTTSSSSSSNPSNVSEEDVRKIVEMGFDRHSAIRELQRTNGDVNSAIAALLARSIKLPPL